MIFLSKRKSNFRKSVSGKFCSVRFFLFLSISLPAIHFSCKTQKQTNIKTVSQRSSDSLSIIVASTNLSEDMSTLSSNDDELALFLYSYKDSAVSELPIFSTYFVLNKTRMSDTLYFNRIKKVVHKDLILFLVEMDTEEKIELIEMQIRKNHNELIKAYREKNYSLIQMYLNDNDMLGVKVLKDFKQETTIEISDIHRMDRYNYQITLK